MSDRRDTNETELKGATIVDEKIEQAIFDLLKRRAVDASICPSEVARSLVDRKVDCKVDRKLDDRVDKADDWRSLMEPVRKTASALMRRGSVEITQRGALIDVDDFKGPIRIRLKADP